MFVLWSLTSLVLEVPSGAWADATSRRGLLALSGVLAAGTFAAWVLAPSFAVFAVGFVLWGAATALASGTLEALTHDALTSWDAVDAYPTLMGRARAGALATTLVATLCAAPLVTWGGYLLPGLAGSAACLASAALALTLPEPPRAPEPPRGPESCRGRTPPDTTSLPGEPSPGDPVPLDDTTAPDEPAEHPDDPAEHPAARPAAHPDEGPMRTWGRMLRAGLAEVGRDALVRRTVVVAAIVTGLVAFDEYLPLLAADRGAAPATVALLLAGVGVAEVAGAALGGPAARARPRLLGALLAGAACAVAVGALLPLAPGFAAIAVGYGAMQTLLVVLDARVQAAVTGPARATVTSVAGFGSEAVAIAVVAAVGLGSLWVALPVLVAALMVPMLAAAGLLVSDDGRS